MVAVVAHQRRHVEVGREPSLALLDQVLEALVGVLGRAEARDLPHRPQPPAVHRRVRPAGIRILSGKPDVLERRVGDIERGVGALEREAAQRAELGLPLGHAGDEPRDFVRFPRLHLRGKRLASFDIQCGRAGEDGIVRACFGACSFWNCGIGIFSRRFQPGMMVV